MAHPVETITKGNKRGEIFYDDQADDPRSAYDELGTMVCFHKRYRLGDKTDIDYSDFGSWNELEDYLVIEKHAVVILPLYLYDHSGITMSTTGFSCGWDSGQVGFIYVDKETCDKEGWDDVDKIKKILVDEVKLYDMYLTGDVYWYRIIETKKQVTTCPHCHEVLSEDMIEEEIESCSGFYGLDDVREVVNGELNAE